MFFVCVHIGWCPLYSGCALDRGVVELGEAFGACLGLVRRLTPSHHDDVYDASSTYRFRLSPLSISRSG